MHELNISAANKSYMKMRQPCRYSEKLLAQSQQVAAAAAAAAAESWKVAKIYYATI